MLQKEYISYSKNALDEVKRHHQNHTKKMKKVQSVVEL